MTHLTIPDKLRNSNHDIEGLYSDCQRVTLTAFAILPMFWSKCSKRTVWILVNCRNSKKEGDQKKVVKVMSEIIFICEVSIRIRIKFARDVPWRVAPLSAILQPPFHYIHFHLMKIIKCFISIAITSKTGYSHFFIVLALEFSRFKIGNLYLWKNFACRDSEARFGQDFEV